MVNTTKHDNALQEEVPDVSVNQRDFVPGDSCKDCRHYIILDAVTVAFVLGIIIPIGIILIWKLGTSQALGLLAVSVPLASFVGGVTIMLKLNHLKKQPHRDHAHIVV